MLYGTMGGMMGGQGAAWREAGEQNAIERHVTCRDPVRDYVPGATRFRLGVNGRLGALFCDPNMVFMLRLTLFIPLLTMEGLRSPLAVRDEGPRSLLRPRGCVGARMVI